MHQPGPVAKQSVPKIMHKNQPSKEVKTASFEGRFVLLCSLFVRIAIAISFCSAPLLGLFLTHYYRDQLDPLK